MISLADLRARNVQPIWQEAVAVVQELLHTVATQGAADRLPDLEHVALIANGDVVALPGSPLPGHPVRHLAIMLQLLVEGTAVPPELEAFVSANIANPPQHGTVEQFSKGLAFFERPGRKSDVERLVGRAIAAEAQTRADEELRRLKEKALEASERGREKEEEAAEGQTRARRRLPAVAAVLIIVLVAASAGLWSWRSQGQAQEAEATTEATPPPVAQPADDASSPKPGEAAPAAATDTKKTGEKDGSLVARVSDAVRSAIGKIAGSSADAPPKAPEAPAAASPPARAARSRRNGAPSLRPVAGPAPAGGAAASSTPPKIEVTEIPTAPSGFDAGDLPVVDDTIYSIADAAVQPPIMVRPVLPAEPPRDVPAEDVGTLELLVNEDGDVEQVRLVSPANRFRERMLVASAKAWKFQPAMKDGQPVKYRTRVRITI